MLNTIDFQGQKFAEKLYEYMLPVFGVIAFIAGFVVQDVHVMLLVYAIGVALTLLLTIPGWPFLFKKHPVTWLPKVVEPEAAPAEEAPKKTSKFL